MPIVPGGLGDRGPFIAECPALPGKSLAVFGRAFPPTNDLKWATPRSISESTDSNQRNKIFKKGGFAMDNPMSERRGYQPPKMYRRRKEL